jgi:hypothetical protein
MRRRRLLLMLAGFPCLGALAWGIMAMLPPQPGVTKANFNRIKEGMTLAEVEAIFSFANAKVTNDPDPVSSTLWGDTWFSDDRDIAVVVWFNNATVVGKEWHGPSETFLDRLRRWLHLL